ncbi:tight adherence protein B [Arcanobacterium phocae]|uniref:Tight adherence protein B n=1 Tax=Arcanobacterium phocae TaxID=131112 RepID=A0A1H2LEB2_9ACTO|nr:hypothetical protein [Arcanobacterium phocae]SDU78766.1 tight adherence protein B [Arcanobacterium phocae]
MLIVVVIMVVAFVSVPRVSERAVRVGLRRRRKPARKKSRNLDMGMVMSEVATRLRSGSSVEQAWQRTLRQCGIDGGYGGETGGRFLSDDGVPVPLQQIWNLSWWQRKRRRISPGAMSALPAAFLVCRMSQGTGAPVADVLDSCANGITEAGEAVAARDIALAGPQTSAFMLAFLPIAGIGFGTLLGAHPIEFFVSSLAGFGVLVLGLGTECAGLWWVRRLVVRARKESEEL